MTPARRERANALLRDVIRSGFYDRWPHLKSHGHKWPTLWGCVYREELREVAGSADGTVYMITPGGRSAVSQGANN